MKRILILTTMLLFAFSSYAQQLEGVWKSSDKFNKKVNKEIDDPDIKTSLGLLFSKTEVYVILSLDADMEGMSMEFAVTIPGTYTRDGDHVSCTFKKLEADFQLTDISSDDPDMKAMLGSEETKAVTMQMFMGQMQPAIDEMKPELAEISDFFSDFTIKSISPQSMTLQLDQKTEAVFTKVQ